MPGCVNACARSTPGRQHVHHARRQRRGERRAELQRGERNRRRQFDDRRVACRQRRGQLRHHHRERPIERNDKGCNAVRLTVQPRIGRLRVDLLGRERGFRHRPEHRSDHRCGVDLKAGLGELGTVGGGGQADDLGRPGRVVHGVAARGTGLRLAADRECRLQRRRNGHDAPPLDPVRSSDHRKSLGWGRVLQAKCPPLSDNEPITLLGSMQSPGCRAEAGKRRPSSLAVPTRPAATRTSALSPPHRRSATRASCSTHSARPTTTALDTPRPRRQVAASPGSA